MRKKQQTIADVLEALERLTDDPDAAEIHAAASKLHSDKKAAIRDLCKKGNRWGVPLRVNREVQSAAMLKDKLIASVLRAARKLLTDKLAG